MRQILFLLAISLVFFSCKKDKDDDPTTEELIYGEWLSYNYDELHYESGEIIEEIIYIDTTFFVLDEASFTAYPEYPDSSDVEVRSIVHITDETVFFGNGTELEIISLDESQFVFQRYIKEVSDKKSIAAFVYERYYCYRPSTKSAR